MKESKSYRIHKTAGEAMRKAVDKVVQEHKKSGRPLVIWKNGKVAKISAKRLRSS